MKDFSKNEENLGSVLDKGPEFFYNQRMSSINPHYTFHYSQPADYHFSHDSVFLAREVFKRIRDRDHSGLKILDLCAGCGVIGLDLLFHCRTAAFAGITQVDFLEVQEIYRPHFEENRRRAGVEPAQASFILGNYADLQSPSYDVIVCNPPYFRVGQGMLSPSEFKNRCRFFIDSDFPTFLCSLIRALKEGGEAYFLLRDLGAHGWRPQKEAEKILGAWGELSRLGDIRGTGFMRFKRDAR